MYIGIMYKFNSCRDINKINKSCLSSNIIYNYIILSGCLFGSIYIFGTTLKLINNSTNNNMSVSRTLNCLSLIISGGIFIYIVFIY